MSSTAGAIEARNGNSIDRDVRACLWLAVVVLAGGLALFLTWRRIAGALVHPPTSGALVGAALALALSAGLLRRGAPRDGASEFAYLLPGLAAVLLLAAITLPGTPALGIVIAWCVLIGGETAAWLAPRADRRPVEMPPAAEEGELPEGLVQQVTRIREENRESIHAVLRAEVPADDRLAVIHLAFCPPLAARPELTAHALDSDDADVKVTQAEVFGARIEVRLPRVADQPRGMLIEAIGSVTCPKCD